MLIPNQIKNYSFPSAGRGTYKASDVDEFKQRIYTAYSELFSENASLKNKFASLASLVEEYNEGKNSIATTMIKAQTFADETIKEARNQAEQIVADAVSKAEQLANEKKTEADNYASEKTADADSYLSRAENELNNVLEKTSKEAEAYIESVNKKAAAIIANANEQASKIVAAAYVDAQKARETCDGIIEQANAKLSTIKAEVAQFRNETKRLLSIIAPAVDDIEVPDVISAIAQSEKQENEAMPEADTVAQNTEFEPFSFDPYAGMPSNVGADDTAVDDTASQPAEENETEQAEQVKEPSVISEKLSESIFKKIDDFDKIVDISTDNVQNGVKGYNGNNVNFSAGGFDISDFDVSDFDED